MSSAKRTPDPDQTRAEILDAAWDLVSEEGAEVSLARIAEAAGISRQSVYLHFGTRGGLLLALVRRADDRFEIRERMFGAFATADPRERLDRVVRVWIDFVRLIHPVATDLVRLRATDADAAAAWEDRMSELRGWLLELVKSLRRDGALAPEWGLGEAAEYLWAAVSVQVYGLLTDDCGWSERRALAVLRRTVAAALLAR
ncbi:MAG: TetR/AcrR family transcriptional regulator [Myxococcota bacterium]